jgi:hypothetical protein
MFLAVLWRWWLQTLDSHAEWIAYETARRQSNPWDL